MESKFDKILDEAFLNIESNSPSYFSTYGKSDTGVTGVAAIVAAMEEMAKIPPPPRFAVQVAHPVRCAVRPHTKKGWMTENYHQRISKKWIKRYGYGMYEPVKRGTMFLIDAHICRHSGLNTPLHPKADKIIMVHPDDEARIRASLAEGFPREYWQNF